jgi:predicted Zn-ribbon and HTH transcriptional regulator
MVNLKEFLLQCNRCGHKWLRRTLTEPKQCPMCRSKQWNKQRIRKIRRDRRAKPARLRG